MMKQDNKNINTAFLAKIQSPVKYKKLMIFCIIFHKFPLKYNFKISKFVKFRILKITHTHSDTSLIMHLNDHKG